MMIFRDEIELCFF